MTEVWEQGSSTVPVKVNGEPVGNAEATETLGQVASRYSSQHGLRTFNVLVNGSKADTSAGSQTLSALGASSVELVAKDARG
jgi:hypothetical protein